MEEKELRNRWEESSFERLGVLRVMLKRCRFLSVVFPLLTSIGSPVSAETTPSLPPKGAPRAAPPSLQQPSPPYEVSVTADAWSWSPPDNARVSIRIEHTASTAGEVEKVIEEHSSRLIERIRKELGESVLVKTQDVSFTAPAVGKPQLMSGSSIRGFRVLGAETSDLVKVSAIIDAALNTPGATVLDVRYSVRNGTAARLSAVAEATRRAQEKARLVASSFGSTLGEVVEASVIEEPAERTERLERQRGDISAIFSDEEVHVFVSLRYRIVGGNL